MHNRLGRITSLVGDVETSQGLPETDGEESEQGEEDRTLAQHAEGNDLWSVKGASVVR